MIGGSLIKLMIFISPLQRGYSNGSTSQIFLMHSRYLGGGILRGL
jgi:hypothetical protein